MRFHFFKPAVSLMVLLSLIGLVSSACGQRAMPPKIPVPSQAAGTQSPEAEWQTYRNSAHHFELLYPPDWVAVTRGDGADIAADGSEDILKLENSKHGAEWIEFEITRVSDLSLNGAAASDLDAYLALLGTDPATKHIYNRVATTDIAGHAAYWFAYCAYSVGPCVPAKRIYFQAGTAVYEINPSSDVPDSVLDKIISSFDFSPHE